MVKSVHETLASLVSIKAFKKARIQSVVCFFIASSSVTLSSLSAFALDQNRASIGTPVDAEGLKKSEFVAKEVKRQDVVEKDGLQFETLIPEAAIKIPEKKPDARVLIRFGCRITNKTQNSIRITWFQTLKPRTTFSPPSFDIRNGYNTWGGTSDFVTPLSILNSSDYPAETISSISKKFPTLMPGESTTFFLNGYLFWLENKLTIQLSDFNFFWVLDDVDRTSDTDYRTLGAGEYYFWLRYNNPEKKPRSPLLRRNEGNLPKEQLWVGSVETPVVKFRLINAK